MGNDQDILDFSKITFEQFKQLVNNQDIVKSLDDNSKSLNKTLGDNSKSLEKILNDNFKANNEKFDKFSTDLFKHIDKQKTVNIDKSLSIDGKSFDSIVNTNNEILSEIRQSNYNTQYLANQIYFFTVVALLIFVSFILYKAIKKFI